MNFIYFFNAPFRVEIYGPYKERMIDTILSTSNQMQPYPSPFLNDMHLSVRANKSNCLFYNLWSQSLKSPTLLVQNSISTNPIFVSPIEFERSETHEMGTIQELVVRKGENQRT